MKKLLLIAMFMITLSLAACGGSGTPLDVEITNEQYSFNQLDVSFVVDLETVTDEDVLEIFNSVASQLYLKYASEIGGTKVTMTLEMTHGEDINTMRYIINESLENPGLQPGVPVE